MLTHSKHDNAEATVLTRQYVSITAQRIMTNA